MPPTAEWRIRAYTEHLVHEQASLRFHDGAVARGLSRPFQARLHTNRGETAKILECVFGIWRDLCSRLKASTVRTPLSRVSGSVDLETIAEVENTGLGDGTVL